ncbi:MFS transporter [Maricurvus nonylphenolicus]|uniref:MFS transporter n=1 Tax=Maricurvus nonylphenolicus TaxID=1008307 RepID=UPI0036F3F94D
MKNQQGSTRLRNFTILLGGTCSVLAAIMISPALPGMAEAFAHVPNADFLVRMVLTMPALFVAVGALLVGALLDRWGRKPVILVSLQAYALAGCAGFFLDSLVAILISRAILGLAVAGIMSGFMTLMLDNFEGKALDRFLGLNGACICLGGIVGLIVAGYLADFGWRYPFLIHLFALLIIPGTLFAVQEPEHLDRPQAEVKAKVPWIRLLPVYATAFSCTALFFILPAQLPFYLMNNNDIGASQVGIALALPSIIGFIFALLYQPLRARCSVQAIAAIIFFAFAISLQVLSTSAAYMVVIAGVVIGGIGVGLLSPNNSGWLASLAPIQTRGRAVGVLTCSIFIGQFFAPILSQPFVASLGLAKTFSVVAIIAGLIGVLFAVLAVRQSMNTVPEHPTSETL